MTTTFTRRTVLRTGAAAPLVAVPTLAAATAPTKEQLETFLAYLHFEGRALDAELGYAGWVPCGTPADGLIFPCGRDWRAVPPSSRAVSVLRAVGLKT